MKRLNIAWNSENISDSRTLKRFPKIDAKTSKRAARASQSPSISLPLPSLSSPLSLKNQGFDVSLSNASSVFDSIKSLSQSDGRWRYDSSSAESSTYVAGTEIFYLSWSGFPGRSRGGSIKGETYITNEILTYGIGAIDGTHIPCMVYNIDQTPYRNRHGFLSQNILAACTFDLKFIYVLAGWEGFANDARVLKDAMSRPYGLPLPQNKFYLVDSGYPNRLQFLAPYRGQRYHLSEFGPANNQQRPRNSKEVFNHRHASLRNCVERIFGVFKSRFTIFKSQPPGFPYATQIKMFVACVGLHNFLRLENTNDDFDIYDLPLEAPRNVADADDDSDEEDELQTQQTQRLLLD
ncbi:protein ALP1-like [Asparagus officinalis]|uniref:protein ALP1-like n=1 Tax=Asparagus officinalis TaxID=4686 RepID=UPI00098DFC42|nr:protein ALP1-like [Asparagus officinalis]